MQQPLCTFLHQSREIHSPFSTLEGDHESISNTSHAEQVRQATMPTLRQILDYCWL